jgi:peptidase A4-like protein
MRPVSIARASVGIAAIAATVLVAAPAVAAPPSAAALTQAHRAMSFAGPHHAIGTPMVRGMRHVSGFNQDGGNWSGYAAAGGSYSSVTSNWTEPSVSCNSRNDLFAPWVGIDGYGTSTVEQTGVATDCSSGSPQYAGWYEMYPAAPVYYSNAVSAGDSISATVTRSSNSYTLTLTDNTKGWTRTTTKSLSARHSTVEVIIESPTAAYPNFGRVNFSGSTANGAPLANVNPTALDAENGYNWEDHTGPLSGGNFSISYVAE